MTRRNWVLGLLLAAISVTAFASTFVVGGRLTRDCGVSPLAIVTIRFFFAGLLMLGFRCRTPEGRRKMFREPTKRDWLVFALIGPIGTSLMAWFVFASCALVSSANAAMSDALSPLMIAVFAAIQARHATHAQVCGTVLGFVGALFVIGIVNSKGLALSVYGYGDVLVLLAALTWAVYTVAARGPVKRLGSAPYTVWTMLFGAVACLPFVFFTDVHWPSSPLAWKCIAYICIVPTLVAFWAWNAAQKHLPMSTLAMTAYFTPVSAAAIGWLIAGERLTAMQWVGTLFICASALVEVKGNRT